MSAMSTQELIEAYAAGGPRLRQAIAGLTRDDLLARPGPGDWSIAELVIHLADSDLIASDRMKRVIAEDNPLLIGFNETRFVAALHSEAQSAEDAATIFELNRRNFVKVLRLLPAEAFARTGVHNEAGKLTLSDLLKTYTRHLDHHLKFLYEKRQRLGKPAK